MIIAIDIRDQLCDLQVFDILKQNNCHCQVFRPDCVHQLPGCPRDEEHLLAGQGDGVSGGQVIENRIMSDVAVST